MKNGTYWTDDKLYDLWVNIGVELMGGIITSILFLLILKALRPKIQISPKIAYEDITDENGNPKRNYTLKFYNKDRFFKCENVRIQLIVCRTFTAPGGKNLEVKQVKIKGSEVWSMEPFWNTKKKKKKGNDQNAMFAKLVLVDEDLDALWKEDHVFLTLKVSAKNSFSGFSKIFSEDYNHKASTVQKGVFRFGSSFDIVKPDSD